MYVVDNLGNAWGSVYNTLVNILLQNVLKLFHLSTICVLQTKDFNHVITGYCTRIWAT